MAGDAPDFTTKGIPRKTAQEAKERGLVSAGFACKRLDISRRQLGRMIRDGDITPEQIDGVNFFEPNDIDEWESNKDSLKPDRDFVLDFALEALHAQNEHVDKLIKLSHDPAQETIKALLAENSSLRKRAQEQEKTVVEVHELYGQLLRETMLAEVEADKERTKMEMRREAFGLFRDKLVPMMIDSAKASKFIDSFSSEQLEAFVESGAATAEQAKTIEKVLKERKAEAAREVAKTNSKAKEKEK